MSAAARKTGLSSRRRSSGAAAPRLGAVRIAQSPLGQGSGSDAGSPMSCSEPTSALATPQTRSPLAAGQAALAASSDSLDSGHVAAPAADGLTQFSQQLAASRSSDRWLEDCLVAQDAPKGPPRRQQSAPAAVQQQGPSSKAVESAASQIVHKALRFITADGSSQQTAAPAAGTAGRATMATAGGRRPSSTAFDSSSFLDKGMDAISGVGRLMEGFAITLDNVIGQAFEPWGPNSSGAPPGIGKPLGVRTFASRQTLPEVAGVSGKENSSDQAAGVAAVAAGVAGQAAKVPPPSRQQQQQRPGSVGGVRQPHITSFMSKLDAASEQEVAEWRKRAQQLAGELQRMREQQEEYQRLRLQYEKAQAELEQTASQASQLAQENCALKEQADPEMGDPLVTQQVARQMEALLSEKSKLAAENDRLLRENTGLQELLEFTLAHQSQLAADGELFGYNDGEEEGLGQEDDQRAAELAAAAMSNGQLTAPVAVGASAVSAGST